MADRFVLFEASFRNPSPPTIVDGDLVHPPPPAILTTAEDVSEAIVVGSAAPYAGQTDLTWVEYDLEEDGVTRCNGRIRDDLPPHAP